MADANETMAAAAEKVEAKPQMAEVKRSWGDEVDSEEEQEESSKGAAADASTSDNKDVSELHVDNLKIEDEDFRNKELNEIDDSSIQAVTSGDTPYTSASGFDDLNLSPELLKGLYTEMKFEKPSKIQAISLPMILTPPHKDLIAQAHNGSGKTTCFVLGMLSRVDPANPRTQALCICPTRELSLQNLEVLRKMGKYTGISSQCAVPMERGNNERKPLPFISAQVVIGTPGTLKKMMSLRKLSTDGMKVLVFDEADQMLAKDGFQDDSLRIMKEIQKSSRNCQVLFFSATFNEAVKSFVSRVAKDDANKLFVKKEELSLNAVKQYKVYCPDEQAKILVIKDRILELAEEVGQTIIFVNRRHSASMLNKALVELGYEVTTIHGAIDVVERDRIVSEFKSGLTQVLIATDVIARGFDQQQVNVVINYDLPIKYGTSEPDYEVYLHRIGRAGRFGRKGAIFNFLMFDSDMTAMEKIEQYFRAEATLIPSWQSDKDFKDALRAAGLL
ncbi:DEAD-box ATP-dependent RNA helicase 38-like [Mercurialis annua]|uniref:DEAD-box ATP-dependent RNA helicase 38-like n=1 Tax=Mercurialis annua TaxID=3986 RepID=UPI00215E0090|nr:DEAD-box ATP-dependent RNA helicase 38-like [Mercurialis annua]